MTVDMINHPPHYQDHPVFSGECMRYTRHMGFADGNAFKYLWRFADKGNPVEDIQKALWYLRESSSQQTLVNPLRAGTGLSREMESEIVVYAHRVHSPTEQFNLVWAKALFDVAHAGHHTKIVDDVISTQIMPYAEVLQGR